MLIKRKLNQMNHELKSEMNKLSLEVFGSSSRWQKIVNNGISEPHERDREIMVPVNGKITKQIVTDTKNMVVRYTIDEVKKMMEDILEQRKLDLAKAQE